MRSIRHEVGIALLLAIATSSAHAQQLEEVVVTAQKREQNLQDVGISVAAISGEAARAMGITSIVDAVTTIPNVTNYSPYGPGSSANIVIRGIGLNDFGEGHEAPVTAYVDEFYLVAVPSVDFSMFDLERVEVLRGPQGTLFGRNSTGGLAHFLTAKPTAEAEGFVTASGGSFGEYKLEGAISGPLGTGWSGRLSALTHHSDGFVKSANPALGAAGQAGTDAVRAQLMWTGDNGLTVLGKLEHAQVDKRHSYYEQIPARPNAANGGLWELTPNLTDFAGYNQSSFANGRAAAANVADQSNPATMDQKGTTALLRIEKDFGETVLTSITGFLDMDRELEEDCDASPNVICFASFPYSAQTLTQEIRWAKPKGDTRWTTGIYFLDADADNLPTATFNVPVGALTDVDPSTGLYNGPLFPLALAADWTLKTKSYSVFGQIERDLSEKLTFIAGARLTRDEKDFTDRDNASLRLCNNFPIPNNCFTDYTATVYTGEYRKTLYSGKLELDWRPMSGVLVYGSLSRGSKAGGFNNGFYPSGLPAEQVPYGDESVMSYEVGTKTSLADGRVRLNVSAFFYDYSDFQTFNWEGIGGLIVNRDATVTGAELELDARLTENLTANLSISGLDTKIKDVTLRDGTTIRDTEMSTAPKSMASGGLVYRMPVGGTGALTASWDFNYVAKRYMNNFDDPASLVGSYVRHNARIEYEVNEHLQIGAFVRNLADKEYLTKVFVFDSLGYAQTQYAEPRVYGAQVSYRW